MFQEIYRNKRVLVTGTTGFKGSWLMMWLRELGADVHGFALAPDTVPNHYSLLDLDNCTALGDIAQKDTLETYVKTVQPDIVFHLAAQSLVRRSYREPIETYQTNVMGTLNLLEACRKTANPKSILVITSDKVYENKEQSVPYKETDILGGYDLYSSSKACVELLTSSYVRSFFHPMDFGTKHGTLIATVRAGNVIGGGDWSEDRLVPDIIRATAENRAVTIRNPNSVRPWQHVLDPLSGYLSLAEKLFCGKRDLAGAWNFGPDESSFRTVQDLQDKMHKFWPDIKLPEINLNTEHVHEAGLLSVDSSKARSQLDWKPVWNFETATEKTCNWYKSFVLLNKVLSDEQLKEYVCDAQKLGLKWAE
jgi:CDP-glucose 4,6-dehydratase